MEPSGGLITPQTEVDKQQESPPVRDMQTRSICLPNPPSCEPRVLDGLLELNHKEATQKWKVCGNTLNLSSYWFPQSGEWITKDSRSSGNITISQQQVNDSPLYASPIPIIDLGNDENTSLWRFHLLPGISGCILQSLQQDAPKTLVHSFSEDVQATGIEYNESVQNSLPADAPIHFTLAQKHLEVTAVEFREQSDANANFTFEKVWMLHPSERSISLQSNLVFLEDPATKQGLILLLLAPLRLVRNQWSDPYDFKIESSPDGFQFSIFPGNYKLAVMAYQGGQAGRTLTLHNLQRLLHKQDFSRDGLILSNTWGDRHRDKLLNEAFVLSEIRAAQDMGIEVVQIDDGWQKGRTANSIDAAHGVWNGFWNSDPDFWSNDSVRFPHGLKPLVQACQRAGLQLGLWYAPDSSNDMEHWEDDAKMILQLWEEYQVAHFKLDAIKITSSLAEQRFNAFLNRVHEESQGAVLVDIDATAELRPTYWGHVSGSAIFLQNRYTDRQSYYPHQTLRALWSLAHYVLPIRLRLEFLNPLRNESCYANSPLRPSAWSPEALFAIVMTTSPLAWMEISNLHPQTREAYTTIINIWKPHREAWHSGDILPIGLAPNGWTWTGFLSFNQNENNGYVLIFRELNENPDWMCKLPNLTDSRYVCEILYGEGDAFIEDSTLHAVVPEPLGFLFLKFN